MVNINALPFELPLTIVNKMRKIYVQSLENPQAYDQIIRGLTPNEKFTVQSLYYKLQNT